MVEEALRTKFTERVLSVVNRRLARSGYGILLALPKPGTGPGSSYAQDFLWSLHNHEFMEAPAFRDAYARAVKAGGVDYRIHWRVHVALWVAQQASKLPGDFVECGVGRGFVSSAVLESLPWSNLNKHLYLFDTFTPYNVQDTHKAVRPGYAENVEAVQANFSEWPRVAFVPGFIPKSLQSVEIGAISYLHLDMNHPDPEVAALRAFWPKMVTGAFLLLDDYAYMGYRSQKLAMDAVARELGFSILSLPTGQGLAVKAP